MWELPQQAPNRGGGRHNPAPVLTPAPAVAPSAFPAGVAAFARSKGRARGGAGRVLGATTELLDWLADPSS